MARRSPKSGYKNKPIKKRRRYNREEYLDKKYAEAKQRVYNNRIRRTKRLREQVRDNQLPRTSTPTVYGYHQKIRQKAMSVLPFYSPVKLAVSMFRPCEQKRKNERHQVIGKIRKFGAGSIAKRGLNRIRCK